MRKENLHPYLRERRWLQILVSLCYIPIAWIIVIIGRLVEEGFFLEDISFTYSDFWDLLKNKPE